MPKFQNTRNTPLNIITNGRKIIVPPNGFIDGPKEFSSYSGLVVVEQGNTPVKSVNVNTTTTINKNVIESNRIAQKNILNLPPKNQQNAARENLRVINEREINRRYGTMVPIPDIFPIDETFNKNIELDRTINHLKNYPNNKPTVGICILTKNSLDLIYDCCESIFEHVKYSGAKLYIFDTGTTDFKVLNYYEAIKKNQSMPVSVINVGDFHFSKNYNDGINQVDTDYVMIQNNDTKAVNDYISRLMRVAIVEKVGLSGPRMLFKDGKIQHDGQRLYNDNGKLENPGHINYTAPRELPGGRHEVDGITAAGVLVKTSWFKQIGGFDEGFKDIYQDVHFCMKNRLENKMSVCDRDSIIYHYDNTSRKKLWNDPVKIKAMRDDHNFLFNKISSGELPVKTRNKKKFSIVTLVNDNKQYFDFLDDIRNQNSKDSFEIIALPNYNNEYRSCAQALNVGMDLSESEYVILCHQDLKMKSNWLENISKYIDQINKNNINWGVLGMAGAYFYSPTNQGGALYLDNKNEAGLTNAEDTVLKRGNIYEVQTLDELCLITKSNIGIRFDENVFDHYHWYGADFCLTSLSRGYKNYAINAPCEHLSDGFTNLLKEDHKEKFLSGAALLFTKWKNVFPYFRTMTALFSKVTKKDSTQANLIHFYVAEQLNKNGQKFPAGISVP